MPVKLSPFAFRPSIESMPRRGGRLIRLERLRLPAVLGWLIEVVEEASGTIGETRMERQRCSDLAI